MEISSHKRALCFAILYCTISLALCGLKPVKSTKRCLKKSYGNGGLEGPDRVCLSNTSNAVHNVLQLDPLHIGREGDNVAFLKTAEIFMSSSMADQYCNFVNMPISGSEGEILDGYTLETVHILIRHGDRGSVGLGRKAGKIVCDVNPAEESYQLLEKYVEQMKVVKMPSGMREFHKFGFVPSSAECKSMKLTYIGILQHLRNGAFFHKRYYEKLNLKGKGMQAVLLKTTKTQRTFQSVIALMHTFLPGVDVTKVTASEKSFCQTGGPECTCAAAERYKALHKSEKRKRLHANKEAYNLVKRLSHIFGLADPASVLGLIDVMMGYYCHGADLPCSNGKCATEYDLDRLLKFQTQENKNALNGDTFPNYAAYKLYGLFREISQRMESYRTGAGQYKVVVYSGHDVTITLFLTALGIFDGVRPGYATRIVIELLQKDGQFFIRIITNGNNLTEKLKFCINDLTKQKLCPLESFHKFVNKELTSSLDFSKENCRWGKTIKS